MEEKNKEEVQQKKSKKHVKQIKGKALTAYIVIIVILALALSYGCGFLLGKGLYEATKPEEPKEETKDTTQEDLNDVKEDYDLLFGDYIRILGDYNDTNELFGRALDHITFDESMSDYSNSSFYYQGTKPAEEVEEMYEDLFGGTLDKSVKYSGICTEYSYDQDKNVYVQAKFGCDAGWGWFVKDYVYKIELDDDYAYVYSAAAIFSGIEKIEILTDKEHKYVYKEVASTDSFELDETNYESFAKYKITFKKENNDFHYVKLEKIEDGKNQ